MRKNLFVLRVNDYRPDLCRFTLPTIRAYAERIGAQYVEITERKFDGYPVTYEKLQVHKLGDGADWNILCDADSMLHPDLPDFTAATTDPGIVRFSYGHDMRALFKPNKYLLRCGHFQAIAGGFVVTSSLTHDLWEPLAMPLAEALEQTKREFILDEYALTHNLAKYGLRWAGVMPGDVVDKFIVHIGNEEKTADQREADLERAAALFDAWGFRA